MMERLTSASLSQADNVEKTNKNGNPAEKPRNNMVITRGLVYVSAASRQLRFSDFCVDFCMDTGMLFWCGHFIIRAQNMPFEYLTPPSIHKSALVNRLHHIVT